MTEPQAKNQEPTPSPYLRLPAPLLAVGLLAFLVVLLAAGVYANNSLRPRGIITPTPAPAESAVAVAAPTSRPTVAPTAAPSVTPTPRPQPTITPTPQVVIVASVSPTPVETALPTVEPALAQEVGQAYDHYWDVRADALLHLDKSHLTEAMDGDHLASTLHLIDELLSENRAIQTNVDHDSHVVQASNDSAQVFDDYLSGSFYVDPKTLSPLTQPASDELRVLYQLRRVDGVWKVVDSISAD